MSDNKTVTTVISENSTIQLGLVIAIIGFIVGAIWWASDMNTRLGSLQESTKKIEVQLEAASFSRWTKIDHDAFEQRNDRRFQEMEKIHREMDKIQRDNQNKIMTLELLLRK